MSESKEEKKVDKKDLYFGFLPKAEVPKFIENFKKALGEGKKEGEKKVVEVKVNGTNDDPKGIAFQLGSFGEKDYNLLVDESQPYMKDALLVFTLSIGVGDPSVVPVLQQTFEGFKPMILEMPIFKKHPEKYQFFFRNKDNRVYLDIVTSEGKFLKPILDLNLNPRDFHNFELALKTEFTPEDAFKCSTQELLIKALSFLFLIRGESNDVKFILQAAIKALKEVKLDIQKYQDKLNEYIGFFDFLNSFIEMKFSFQFNAKELSSNGVVASELSEGNDVNKQIEEFKTMAKTQGKEMVVPMLESMQMLDLVKGINIDEISISISLPKYKSGVRQLIKLPEITKVIHELFFN